MHGPIVKFREPPEKQPRTVCFHYPGTFLTHSYVLDIAASAAGDDDDGDDDDHDDDHDHDDGDHGDISYVLDMIQSQLKSVDNARVRTIEFVNRNTIHATEVHLVHLSQLQK